jgi:AraC-like DNA-binding protein/quercetin dioxygenase-like cupin family protein
MTLIADSAPWQPDSLDRALAALEWTLIRARRLAVPAGESSTDSASPSGFVYVSSGTVRLTSDTIDTELAAGDIAFFPREQRRGLRASADAQLVDVLLAPASTRPSVLDAVPTPLVVHGFAEREPNMIALLEGMPCPVADGTARRGALIVCSRIATAIVSAVIQQWAEHGCAPAQWLREDDDPHIRRAIEALHQQMDRAWSVGELARVATMSRSAFAVRFREVVGQSPASYLASARMEVARELLPRPELTVADIARRLGYESDAGFSRAFRRDAGMPPALWRVQHLRPAASVAAASVASVSVAS